MVAAVAHQSQTDNKASIQINKYIYQEIEDIYRICFSRWLSIRKCQLSKMGRVQWWYMLMTGNVHKCSWALIRGQCSYICIYICLKDLFDIVYFKHQMPHPFCPLSSADNLKSFWQVDIICEHPRLSGRYDKVVIFLHGVGGCGPEWARFWRKILPLGTKLILPTAPRAQVTLLGGREVNSWWGISQQD